VRSALPAWVLGLAFAAPGIFDLPPAPPRDLYGTVRIDRAAAQGETKSVAFPHWLHRTRFTCRVCHVEVGFAMRANATGVSRERVAAGELCGACHDGTVAFDYEAACERCHSGSLAASSARFVELRSLLPAPDGNQIDWVGSIRSERISPAASLFDTAPEPMRFGRLLQIDADWSMVSPAVFPHDEHLAWLDCSQCHPGLFNIEKKATAGFGMAGILDGRYCGACHHRVAFPLGDCRRCHPRMRAFP
jgi:c(7)-type cytochrome triheme protein